MRVNERARRKRESGVKVFRSLQGEEVRESLGGGAGLELGFLQKGCDQLRCW
jgi:hypothetical protein